MFPQPVQYADFGLLLLRHYDLMMIMMSLVILFTNCGHYSLMNRLG
jgi:hypothetical protein